MLINLFANLLEFARLFIKLGLVGCYLFNSLRLLFTLSNNYYNGLVGDLGSEVGCATNVSNFFALNKATDPLNIIYSLSLDLSPS